jgi:hypothetical protein
VFADDCGTKWPKAAAKITDDLDVLLAFYDYPRRLLDPPAHHQPDRVDRRRGLSGEERAAQPHAGRLLTTRAGRDRPPGSSV